MGQLRFKLLLDPNDNLSHSEDQDDSEAIIKTKALEHGVLALPGTVFLPNSRKTAYVRASFSTTEPDNVDEAMRRLRDVVLEARGNSKGGG
jgi:tryptophan aminotransferase